MVEVIKMDRKPCEKTGSGPSAGSANDNHDMQAWRKAIATLINSKPIPDEK